MGTMGGLEVRIVQQMVLTAKDDVRVVGNARIETGAGALESDHEREDEDDLRGAEKREEDLGFGCHFGV